MSRGEMGEDKVERGDVVVHLSRAFLEANFLYKRNIVSFRRRRIR
jgi:hypothetical protein